MHPPTPSELHSQDTFFTRITDSSHQAERVASYSPGTPTSPVLLGNHTANAHADFLLRTAQGFFFCQGMRCNTARGAPVAWTSRHILPRFSELLSSCLFTLCFCSFQWLNELFLSGPALVSVSSSGRDLHVVNNLLISVSGPRATLKTNCLVPFKRS